MVATFPAGRPAPAYADLTAVELSGDERGWTDLVKRSDASFDTVIHCPFGGSGRDGAEGEIRSAWLTAKFANTLLPENGGKLLTLITSPEGNDAVDRAAASAAIAQAGRAAMLDASKLGIAICSNRMEISRHAPAMQIEQTIEAFIGDRTSFLAGAQVALGHVVGTPGDFDLAGRTYLVTGATSGIGRATAIEIARRGGWVAVGGRKLELARETVELARAAGGDGMFVPLDITQEIDWQRAVTSIMAERGQLDGLVNNAGDAKNLPIQDLPEETLRYLVHLNYAGCRAGMIAAVDALAETGGAIVNVASVAGIRAGYGGSAYGASKSAMIALSSAFAEQVAQPRGVRVNSIQPGLIWSDSVVESLGEEGAAAFRRMVEAKTPLGRVGTPDEVARFIAFLVSGAAASISGQAIPVSGGLELLFP
ncbi:SDR family NAD(P)-dependent oxidoreductase [Pelagerythrobacter sp.]|uniref:SDR family NAD(P)-dependent oxidoreductase n=1 Tax=Pelagerythrobacter sp. TaxID=2800702 RepID=UPI0035B3A9E4